jgi:transcriptional regulator GlxA family with amidase domain
VITRITNILKQGISDFEFNESLDLYKLILSSVSTLDSRLWQYQSLDSKIFEVMRHMNRNPGGKLTNEILAALVHMSTNSFARLFKQQTGLPPQKYLTKTRIENACNLMHHSNLSINEIADKSGFSDRYYFTKVFNSIMHVPPAHYRKQVLIKKN